MRKSLIFLAILVGLVWNIFVYFESSGYAYATNSSGIEDTVCPGFPEDIQYAKVEGGAPLKSTALESNMICEPADSSKNELIKLLIVTPQFFINWAIWSSLLIGIIYAFTRNRKS